MARDELFRSYVEQLESFRFDESVVRVFDDMAHRSIPDYRENLEFLTLLAREHYQSGSQILDLGCSTGNLSLALADVLQDQGPRILAVDKSEDMIRETGARLQKFPKFNVELECADILELRRPKDSASVIFLNYTLQFIAPEDRQTLLEKLFSFLIPGGLLIISEKVHSPRPAIERTITDQYYRFKKNNGYSNTEIARKRESLENVLITDTPDLHIHRLEKAGFQSAEIIWRKWNFLSISATK